MRTLTLFILLLLAAACGAQNTEPVKVVICTGPNSTTYHTKATCKGLRYCYRNTKIITLADAEALGRRPCKMCHHKKRVTPVS